MIPISKFDDRQLLPNIHILGIQGSGKGTQSAYLVEKYRLNYISSGDLFRKRSEESDEFAGLLKEELKTGQLLPNDFLYHTVEDYLKSNTVQKGLLGDGVIRTIEQYNGLWESWGRHKLGQPILVHLILSEEIAMQRIEKRQAEQNDPKLQDYHLKYSGKLLKRNDDNPKAIRERFALFHQMTEPVINIFDTQHRCVHIDASASVELISQEICESLESLYPEFKPKDVTN